MKRTTTTMVLAGVCVLSSARAYAQQGDPTAPPPATSPAEPSTGTGSDQPPSASGTWNPSTETAPVTTPEDYPAAQPVTPVARPANDQPANEEDQMRHGRWGLSRVGAAVLLGGGYEDFTQSNVRALTGAGGSWAARLVAGTRQFIGLEAAYVGSARSIQTLGLATDTNLVSNGVEGALRINIPVVGMAGRSLLEPFGFIGAGWQHYNLTHSSSNTSDIANTDDVVTMPYGGGLEFSYDKFMLDARFTYRQTYNNDMLRATGNKLNNWGVGGQLGVEF